MEDAVLCLQATRDFAVEAAQLSEALAQKEEEVQMTGQQMSCCMLGLPVVTAAVLSGSACSHGLLC